MKLTFPLTKEHKGKYLFGKSKAHDEIIQINISPWCQDKNYVNVDCFSKCIMESTKRPILIEFCHLCFREIKKELDWTISATGEPRENEKPEASKQRMVYFVEGNGFVKIGATNSISTRLHDLQVGCPFELKLVTTLPGGEKVERQLHDMFAKHRKRGEWFEFHQEIKDYIANCL